MRLGEWLFCFSLKANVFVITLSRWPSMQRKFTDKHTLMYNNESIVKHAYHVCIHPNKQLNTHMYACIHACTLLLPLLCTQKLICAYMYTPTHAKRTFLHTHEQQPMQTHISTKTTKTSFIGHTSIYNISTHKHNQLPTSPRSFLYLLKKF